MRARAILISTRVALILAGAFASIAPTASQAQFSAGCRCSTISGYHRETRAHVSEETTEAARQIVDALRSQTKQNSNYIDRQVEANRRIADGEAQNRATMARSIIRAEAESGQHDPSPDFCLLMDAAAAAELPPKNALPGMDGVIGSAADWSAGRAVPVRENGVKMAAWLAEERSRLSEAGGAADATTDWEFALDSTTLPTDDAQYRQALTRLIANTVDPFPPRPLSEDDLTSPAGLAEAVRRQVASARNRAAIAALTLRLELATPVHLSNPYRTIAARSRYSDEIPEVISEMQALDIRTTAYFAPTQDALELRYTKTEAALLQDLIDLQSINARISLHRLEQESRNAVVLSAILGIMTDGTTANLQP